MHREEAIVEFFRARLGEHPDAGDSELLERYDYCQRMYCPGNEDLGWAMREYENHVFPARIARFADHPAHAALTANRWIAEDYIAARDSAGASDA